MNQQPRSPAFGLPARTAALPVAASCALLLGGCFFGHHASKSGSAVTVQAPVTKVVPAVVRPAPEFTWLGLGNKPVPLKALRGQPVVLLIAPSPDQHEFRKQVGRIDSLYLDLSERKTVFLAAFTFQPGRVASNVPYAMAQNGAAVAKAYGVAPDGFAVVVISPDGNMNLISMQVEAAQRLLDMINNSFQVQAAARTGLGS